MTGKLKIAIYAPAFDSKDGTQREIDVPDTGNSSWAPFELVANKAGAHPIEVLAWKNSAQVGSVTISIGVDAARVDQGSVNSRLEMREPEEGEYILEVTLKSEPNRYQFQLRSNTGEYWPPMYSDILEGHKHAAYVNVIARLNEQARNKE